METSASGSQRSQVAQVPQQKRKMSLNVAEEPELPLEAFVTSLQLHLYAKFDPEQRRMHLARFDALDLFQAVQELNQECAMARLENHVLTLFLEKNDPRLLVGLKQRRATASVNRRLTLTSLQGGGSLSAQHAPSSRRSMKSTTMSVYTTGSMALKKDKIDYKLNFRAKAEMTEKVLVDVETRIKIIESDAIRLIKLLKARIEEMQICCNETQETITNFRLHFLRDEQDIATLETSTEKQLERKLRKFMANWIKNARALLATMRLRITAVQENCQQHRSDLITKADLVGVIGAVDFEMLTIKRTELLTTLDDKNAHMQGLKGVAGKASLSMSEEKQLMMAIEDESKRITTKTVEVVKAIVKLEKEIKYVEEDQKRDARTLTLLQEQLDRYEAPSLNEYIEKKNEMLMLEKEEKMLQRKIPILYMKLSGLQKRHKH